MEQAKDLGPRLLALLHEVAGSLVHESRATVLTTTIGEQYQHNHDGADNAVYVLRPTRSGALPVCLMPAGNGWYLLPGDGPSVEFWAGADADYEQTRALARAVVAGQYRYWFEQREEKPVLLRWRPPRHVWLCTGKFAIDGNEFTNEDWNAPPRPDEPLEVDALPY